MMIFANLVIPKTLVKPSAKIKLIKAFPATLGFNKPSSSKPCKNNMGFHRPLLQMHKDGELDLGQAPFPTRPLIASHEQHVLSYKYTIFAHKKSPSKCLGP